MKYSQHPWFRPRHYLHFDRPVCLQAALQFVSDPLKIAQHSFYPFISFTVTSQKIKFDHKINRVVRKPPKKRPISYAAHLDSHIYAYYSSMLSAVYESKLAAAGLGKCVLAFRALNKSNIHFAKDAFDEIIKRGDCHAIALDVKGFFDNLDHNILKKSWSDMLGMERLPNDHYAVFKSIARYSSVDKIQLYELLGISNNNPKRYRNRVCEPDDFRNIVRSSGIIKSNKNNGIPQGSPISALLSNLYMFDFDLAVNEFVENLGGKYLRYCDDMLLIVNSSDAAAVKLFVHDKINELKLIIQDEKTEERIFKLKDGVCTTVKPLQYLGFLFDGQNIFLRSASLARYSDRMRRGVKLAKATMDKSNKRRMERGELEKPLFKRKLYKRYSYLGRRNFISYGYRSAEIMNSESIRKQLKPLWHRLKLSADI